MSTTPVVELGQACACTSRGASHCAPALSSGGDVKRGFPCRYIDPKHLSERYPHTCGQFKLPLLPFCSSILFRFYRRSFSPARHGLAGRLPHDGGDAACGELDHGCDRFFASAPAVPADTPARPGPNQAGYLVQLLLFGVFLQMFFSYWRSGELAQHTRSARWALLASLVLNTLYTMLCFQQAYFAGGACPLFVRRSLVDHFAPRSHSRPNEGRSRRRRRLVERFAAAQWPCLDQCPELLDSTGRCSRSYSRRTNRTLSC